MARKILVKVLNDPSCTMDVHGRSFRLPLSHMLPVYMRQNPFYDSMPGRLSNYLHDRYGYLKGIDVGANIGDSVAAFFRHETDRFLAIEPNPHFADYFRKNWGNDDRVTLLKVLCSSKSQETKYEINEKSGTASIVSSEGGVEMRSDTLDSIVGDQSGFADFNLLKIDTDGYDFDVMNGARTVIADRMPAVFFECEAFSNPRYVENCMEALRYFNEVGYRSFLLYDNRGHLMGRFPLDDLSCFAHLLFYQLSGKVLDYDILVMKEDDILPFTKSEQAYYTDNIPDASMRGTANIAAERSAGE